MEIILSALLIIFLDQISKYFVIKNNPSVYINRGIMFGLFKDNQYAGWLYTVAWISVSFYLYAEYGLNDFSLGLIIGGTVSNKIDRFTVGGAIDWINLWGPIRSFNFADIGIATGLIIWLAKLVTMI